MHFYRDLPALKLPLPEVFRPEHFREVPGDWHAVVSDTVNSTAAIAEGRHNHVNLMAAGSLIAVLNIARAHGVEVPFFFGGDGSIALVPAALHAEVMTALARHNANSRVNFGLHMHTGSITVREIAQAGHRIALAKVYAGKGFHKAVALGDGLLYAENRIKQAATGPEPDGGPGAISLEGLECKWDRIKPPAPAADNEVVCYLIEAARPEQQLEVYRDVLLQLERIYGTPEQRNPLSAEHLRLVGSYRKIRDEMMAKYGRWKPLYFAVNLIRSALGPLAFRYDFSFGDIGAKAYLAQMIAGAETLTLDGRINTILSGLPDRREAFLVYLSGEERAGRLRYGHHISRESIMTCYIENYADRHLHFVDGSDSGFTRAALELKSKMR
jgi:hypothetical protein